MVNESDWESFGDPMASEREMAKFLFAFVCHLKPKLIVETGCYLGDVSLLLATSGFRFVCCDTDSSKVEAVKHRWSVIDARNVRGEDLPELREADFVYVDSGDADTRITEAELCKLGAVIVIHDTRTTPQLSEYVRSKGGLLFDTYRGFGIIVKSY